MITVKCLHRWESRVADISIKNYDIVSKDYLIFYDEHPGEVKDVLD